MLGLVSSPHVMGCVGIWQWVLSHIDEIKGLENVYKFVSYSTHYQLVLSWNLIGTYIHDSFVKSPIDIKNLTKRLPRTTVSITPRHRSRIWPLALLMIFQVWNFRDTTVSIAPTQVTGSNYTDTSNWIKLDFVNANHHPWYVNPEVSRNSLYNF